MMIDITSRVEAERVVRRALHEKELLLKEIHHRIKNNLAIVSSLLDFQAGLSNESKVRHILRESQRRILSVARLHEVLYQSSDVTTTHVADYLHKLIDSLNEALGTNDIVIESVAAGSVMSTDQALHFGLIVNELVTSAGFPAGSDATPPKFDSPRRTSKIF